MCLTFVAFAEGSPSLLLGRYKLILVNNRDEDLSRPTSSLAWRDDILAGWDERDHGTWLGVDKRGRVANVLSITQPHNSLDKKAPSRGTVVSECLNSEQSTDKFLAQLSQKADQYNGFQLLALESVPDHSYQLCSMNNRFGPVNSSVWLPGIYCFGNSPREIPFRKATYGEQLFRDLLDRLAGRTAKGSICVLDEDKMVDQLFSMSSDQTIHFPDEQIRVQVGAPVGSDAYKFLCSIFVDGTKVGRNYGTRSTSVVLVDGLQHCITFYERRLLDPKKEMSDPGKWERTLHRFQPEVGGRTILCSIGRQ